MILNHSLTDHLPCTSFSHPSPLGLCDVAGKLNLYAIAEILLQSKLALHVGTNYIIMIIIYNYTK